MKKGETTLLNSLGATFEEVSEQEKQSLNIDFGVKIVELNMESCVLRASEKDSLLHM